MKTTLISILLFSFSISVTAQTAEYTEKDSISDLQWQNELHCVHWMEFPSLSHTCVLYLKITKRVI